MTATQWLEVLISYSLQVVIVVAICKLLERALPRSSDRCAIWNQCFLSILILGCSAVLLPRVHLVQPWSTLEPRMLLEVSTAQSIFAQGLLVVWSIGAAVSLVRWLQRAILLRRAIHHCTPLSDGEVERLLPGATISRGGNLQVLISDEADGPFCRQMHRPTIVLPRFLLEGSRDDLRYVLLHELEHLRTHHPSQLFLQHLAQVICWFHPAVWRAGGRASLTREFSCDEVAANHGAESAPYLRTLLRIAERCENSPHGTSIGFGSPPSEIVLRARQLVKLAASRRTGVPRNRLGRTPATVILVVVTCAAGLLSIPSDPLASSRSAWSPWPSWSAKTAHSFGVELRDYEQYDRRTQVFEIMRDAELDPAEVRRTELAGRVGP